MLYCVAGVNYSPESESRVRPIGEYEALGDAIAASKQLVDTFLAREFKPDMQPDTLFDRYVELGETPYISRSDSNETVNVPEFNHLRYSKARCAELRTAATKLAD